MAADHRTPTMPTDELLSLVNPISLLKRSPRSYITRRVTNPRNGQRSRTIGLVLVMLQFRSTKTVAWFSNSPRLVCHHRPVSPNPSRLWLAGLNPPFFIPELNEWSGQGMGFIE